MGSRRAVLERDHASHEGKEDVCKAALCKLHADPVDRRKDFQRGTGWVMRGRAKNVVLITARHVLAGNLDILTGQKTVVTGDVSATFKGGRELPLDGCAALVPAAGEAHGPPDVVVVELPADRMFPVGPIPCLLDAKDARNLGGGGYFTLLHHPSDIAFPSQSHGKLTLGSPSESDGTPSWLVGHDAQSDKGSSGGMLMDYLFRPFAVHVTAGSKVEDRTKRAVLLSVVHERLGKLSPFLGVEDAGHERCTTFHLPPLPDNFVGREKDLRLLHGRLLQIPTPITVVTAARGLPGVGKSTMVAQYVHEQRWSGNYQVVAWILAESVVNAERDLIALGEHLGYRNPMFNTQSQNERALRVVSFLANERYRDLLLVFDNASSFQTLRDLVPQSQRCSIIFTARDVHSFRSPDVLSIDPMSSADSLQLLGLLSEKDVKKELRSATKLCNAVERLPLAVRLLAVYAKVHKRTFSAVLADVRRSVDSTREFMEKYSAHKPPVLVVAAIWLVCGDLDGPDESALKQLSQLAPDRVPASLLGGRDKCRELHSRDIVSFPETGLLSVHRLVQQVAAARLTHDERQRVTDELAQKLWDGVRPIPWNGSSTRSAIPVVAPHVKALMANSAIGPAGSGSNVADNTRRRLVHHVHYHYNAVAPQVQSHSVNNAMGFGAWNAGFGRRQRHPSQAGNPLVQSQMVQTAMASGAGRDPYGGVARHVPSQMGYDAMALAAGYDYYGAVAPHVLSQQPYYPPYAAAPSLQPQIANAGFVRAGADRASAHLSRRPHEAPEIHYHYF